MEPEIMMTALTTAGPIVTALINNKKVKPEELLNLQQQVFTITSEANALLYENRELRERCKTLETEIAKEKDIDRHKENYITLKSDGEKIKYCAICYGNTKNLIQMNDYDVQGFAECHVCKNRIVTNWEKYRAYCDRIRPKRRVVHHSHIDKNEW